MHCSYLTMTLLELAFRINGRSGSASMNISTILMTAKTVSDHREEIFAINASFPNFIFMLLCLLV